MWKTRSSASVIFMSDAFAADFPCYWWPYKGKGVRYAGERIVRKAGKAGKK